MLWDCLSHENGMTIYNLLLEYAPGGSLADLINKYGGKIPECDVRRYTRMILKGLSSIHNNGYVHCDLKPANILVFPSDQQDFQLKIADFGLAKEPDEDNSRKFFYQYTFRGTPLYMSPESVKHAEISPALDIWWKQLHQGSSVNVMRRSIVVFDWLETTPKPANILVFPSDQQDFQLKLRILAWQKSLMKQFKEILSHQYTFRGTPLYMSPESVKLAEISPALIFGLWVALLLRLSQENHRGMNWMKNSHHRLSDDVVKSMCKLILSDYSPGQGLFSSTDRPLSLGSTCKRLNFGPIGMGCKETEKSLLSKDGLRTKAN
ncbi:hypothetical protein GH714_001874 [Hevea brasiliensis]|uniref:Protein kinase domain-containing protein n=1 Tax=Hevea brasiliensis TaxID=3981 RepID=A0A6A6MBQ0_HEVBR|nr:hypothetical protein GH714_001874 [Hevea brasiliensis]